jgi:photosystem II stability/assembly factor-like uncharacterized protein
MGKTSDKGTSMNNGNVLNKSPLGLSVRLAGCLLWAVLLFSAGVLPVHGQTDLLLTPAEKSDRAPFSILMEIKTTPLNMVAVGERGHILFSDSECAGWTQATSVPVSVTLTAVAFPSETKGWAVGHDGVVLHTEDGGKTWVKQLDGLKINELIIGQLKQMIQDKKEALEKQQSGSPEVQAGDEAAEAPEAPQEEPEVGDTAETEEAENPLALEIENLGYFLSDVELAVEEGPVWPLMDVWFKNDQEGIIIGAFGMILGTTDGGKTWNPMLDRIKNTDGLHLYAVTRSGDDLFIAGESGMLFRSEDFGNTWKQLESPYDGSYFGLVANPAGGFITAFGLRGNIYCSTDRGETWYPADTGAKASISGGTFLSDGSFCIVCVDGSILISPDLGKTFKTLPARFPGAIAVAELRRGIITVAGLRGVTRIDLNNLSSDKKG